MVDLTLPDVAPARGAADAGQRVVARVLAWQHRHPLARRIAAGDVGGLGVIALPYGPGDAGGATPLFHQPSLLPGLSHRVLVEFAARHAVGQRPGPADWPQRDIERADAAPEPAPQTRYLLTATVADPRSATPRRVLLAPEGPAVWGRRALDRLRVAAAAGLVVLVLASLVAWAAGTVRRQQSVSAPAAGASAAASAASAARVPAGPAAPTAPASRPAATAVVAATASVPAPAASAEPAAPVRATAASVPARPSVSAASAPMTAATQAAPPAAPASVPPPQLLPMPSRAAVPATPGPAPSSQAAAPSAPSGPHFALVSMPSKKRADAEATLKQVRQLLGPAIGNLQVQVMPSPQGFVVTLWPLPTQADAERVAEVLARRGVPMKWLEF